MTEVAALKRAVLTLRSRVEQAPKDAPAAFALAEALFRLAKETPGDPARQVEYLTRAVSHDPYDARLRIALGRARVKTGDVKGGVESFVAAAGLKPKDPGPWLALGNALVAHYRAVPEAKAKMIDRALEAYDKALALDPSLHAVHAAKLHAAACARVAGRPLKVIPTAMQSFGPTPELAPAMTWLALELAYAIHFPKHVGTKVAKDRITTDEKTAKTTAYRALLAGLETWSAHLVDADFAMPKAAIEIFDAELPDGDDEAQTATKAEAFALAVLAAAPRFSDRWLLHLVVHQKLEEIADPATRVAVVRAVIGRVPLAVGMDRELFAALNAAARGALLENKAADAQKFWSDGLAIDRYCIAFHHNLALVALHQRDAASLAVHLQSAVDLQLAQWCLHGERTDLVERLAAQHAIFAARLEKSVATELGRSEGEIDPNLLAAWIGETQISFVMQAVLGALARGTAPDAALRNVVASYLREQPAIADPGGVVPPALLDLLDPVQRRAPHYYDWLGVVKEATAEEIEKGAEGARSSAMELLARALGTGERGMLDAAQKRLARISEAKETLLDAGKRAAYDASCITYVEHAYNKARYTFVDQLADHITALAKREKHELVRLLARAYRMVPLDRIAEYFPGDAYDGIRTHIINHATRLPHLRELMEQDKHAEAYQVADQALAFLETWRSTRGDLGAWVNYFLAVCEYRKELAYVRLHGVNTAAGVTVLSRAKERLTALGGPMESDDDDDDDGDDD